MSSHLTTTSTLVLLLLVSLSPIRGTVETGASLRLRSVVSSQLRRPFGVDQQHQAVTDRRTGGGGARFTLLTLASFDSAFLRTVPTAVAQLRPITEPWKLFLNALNITQPPTTKCHEALLRLSLEAAAALGRITLRGDHHHDARGATAPQRNWTDALRIYDAWGRPQAGLISSGQFLWYGDYRQCKQASGRYCLIKVGDLDQLIGDPTPVLLRWGICLPKQCSSHDVSNLLQVIDVNNVTSVGCQKTQDEDATSFWPIQFIILAAILAAILLITTVGRRNRPPLTRPSRVMSMASSAFHLDSRLTYKSLPHLWATIKEKTWWKRILLAFSVRLNLKWLFRQSASNDSRIPCIYGIRTLSMWWVILSHSYLFSTPHVSNLVEMVFDTIDSPVSQLILNGSLAVDTFFMLSGLLTAFIWRGRHRAQPDWRRVVFAPTSWGVFVVHRLVRLLPPYMFVLGVAYAGFHMFAEGPRWSHDELDGVKCSAGDWWKHALFLVNYFKTDCMSWMWYLSLDVQFYLIIAPIQLCLLKWNQKVGITVGVSAMLASSIARGVLCHVRGYPPMMALLLPYQRYNVTEPWRIFHEVYAAPWMRFSPFIVGMLCGWLMSNTNDLHARGGAMSWSFMTRTSSITGRHTRFLNALLWLGATQLLLVPLFAPNLLYNGLDLPIFDFVLNAFGRTFWAIGVAAVICMCHAGKGGYVARLLDMNVWVSLSRLTYAVYLVHELVMIWWNHRLRKPINFEDHFSFVLTNTLPVGVLSYGMAVVVAVLIEMPPLTLERLLFKTSKKRRAKRTTTGVSELRTPTGVKRETLTETWLTSVLNRGVAEAGGESYGRAITEMALCDTANDISDSPTNNTQDSTLKPDSTFASPSQNSQGSISYWQEEDEDSVTIVEMPEGRDVTTQVHNRNHKQPSSATKIRTCNSDCCHRHHLYMTTAGHTSA